MLFRKISDFQQREVTGLYDVPTVTEITVICPIKKPIMKKDMLARTKTSESQDASWADDLSGAIDGSLITIL